MVLVIGSWFEEPLIEFKVSHKVHNFIREQIIDDILKPRSLYDENDKDFIGIQTRSAKSPDFDK